MSEEFVADESAPEESSAPVVESEVPAPGAEDAPVEEAAAEEATEPELSLEERLEQWGGLETAEQAVRLYRDITGAGDEAEQARTQMLLSLAQYYGISQRELASLLPGVDAPAEPEVGEVEDDTEDEVLTVKKFQEMQREAAAQAERMEAQRAGKAAFDATVAELGLNDQQKIMVATLGDKYLKPKGEIATPEEVQAALKKGYAEYQKAVEEEAKRYFEEKKATKEKVPSPISGGATPGGGEPLPPSKDMRETLRRAREQILGAG